uniref:C2H2-type domain-containing protein n=1 Tax=Amphiprion percula TaxID=161767 RepID=A0A3P8TC96_AMPPE
MLNLKPGCFCTFDTRQKLKVHLLNHAEDPRPYQCNVEGCGWAFATSYKLKRHRQSHDKQRATRLTNHQRVHFEPQRPHKLHWSLFCNSHEAVLAALL